VSLAVAPSKRKKAATLAGCGLNLAFLLLNLVYAIARLCLRGLDLEAVLLGGGREEAPDRMFLPIRGFHDLGQGHPLGPANQRQDFRALALSAGRAGFLGMGGFGLLAGLGLLLRRGFGFAALGGFLPLGRTLLLGGTLLRGGLLRRNVRALFRDSGGVFGCSGFCVRHSGEFLSALSWRMTIHHSGCDEMQGN
jgi:hypothetical protein